MTRRCSRLHATIPSRPRAGGGTAKVRRGDNTAALTLRPGERRVLDAAQF